MKKFNVLNDKQYLNLVNEIQDTLNEVKVLHHRGMRKEVIQQQVEPKLNDLKSQLKQYVTEKERALSQELNSYKAAPTKEYDNPTQELLKRQDFQAQINLMNEAEFADYISSTNAESLSVHDYSVLNDKFNSLGDHTQNNLREVMSTLKEDVINPHAKSEAYQQLQDDYVTISNITTKHDGNPWLVDEAGQLKMLDLNHGYNEVFKQI